MIQFIFKNKKIFKQIKMKKVLTFISFTILTILFVSCWNTREEDFMIKKYETENIKILTTIETDSAFSPHEKLEKLYRITHNGLNDANYDSLYNEFINLRRQFINPSYNNCIKTTYAIKVNGGEPQIYSIYYVNHAGNTCMHDKEMMFRQFIDVDHNFFTYHFIEKTKQDSCLIIK